MNRLFVSLYHIYGALVLLFLVGPLLAIIPLSFNTGQFFTYPLEGFSLQWYEEIFSSQKWMRAIWHSFVVGSMCTVFSLIIGVPAAVALVKSKIRLKGPINMLIISPMVIPVIVSTVGIFFFFARIGLTNTLFGLALSHTVLAIPFVVIAVSASLQSLALSHTVLAIPFVVIAVSASLQSYNDDLTRAAVGLGATPLHAFRKVTLPLILPGVITGGLFAFATSLDEVVTAIFLTGPAQRTLPREMFDGLRENISPTILSVATLLVILASILMVAVEILRRKSLVNRGIR